MVAFTKEEIERAKKRLVEVNKSYKGLSKSKILKRKIVERDTAERHQKIEKFKKDLQQYKHELRTLEIKPQDSQMSIHRLPTDSVYMGSKYSRHQRQNKGQYI